MGDLLFSLPAPEFCSQISSYPPDLSIMLPPTLLILLSELDSQSPSRAPRANLTPKGKEGVWAKVSEL